MNRSRILRFIMSAVLITLFRMAVGGQAAPPTKVVVTRDISALTNIFAAGQTNADGEGGGYAPTAINLQPGKNRSLTFQTATGDASCCGPTPLTQPGLHGPDGNKNPFPSTDITGANHLSGLIHKDRILFLVGVFLSADYTHDPTPPVLKYSLDGRQADGDKTIPTSFTDFTPALNQVFFIGDGNSGDNPGTGTRQTFHIPDGANRFYMGYVDGLNIGSGIDHYAHQPPGYYGDNAGGAHVTVEITNPATPLPPPRYAVADLGSLKKDNHPNSFLGSSAALALNDNGQIVGSSDTFSGERHAFFFNGGFMLDMGTLGGDCYATGINNLGSIVGYSNTGASLSTAFLHDFPQGVSTLQNPRDILFPNTTNSRAYAVGLFPRTPNQSFTSDALSDPIEIAGAHGSNPSLPFTLIGDTLHVLDNGSAGEFRALDVGGIQAGFFYMDGGTHAFASANIGYDIQTLLKQQMGVPEGSSIAYGVNANKRVVGAYGPAPDGSASRAFLFDAGLNQVINLDYGTLGPTYAFGINKNDVAVGSDAAADDVNHGKALLFQNGLVYDLNAQIDAASGWRLQKAFAINVQGQIAGVGLAPNGEQHAFLLTPLPNPAPPRRYPLPSGRVLIVANKNSNDSLALAEYYRAARHISSDNVCKINCVTTEDLPYQTNDGTDYFSTIETPIRQFISTHDLHVDYIVLMKGIPLRATVIFSGESRPDQGTDLGKNYAGLSVTSLLTTLDTPPSALKNKTYRVTNPYYKGPKSHASYAGLSPNPNQTYARFRHDLHGLYLVTRLDAYTFARCRDLVDWSLNPNVKDGWFLSQPDLNRFGDVNDQMGNAHDLLVSKGLNSSLDYQFVYPQGANLVGYSTYGSNHTIYAEQHAGSFHNLYYGSPDAQAQALNDSFVAAFRNTTFRPGGLASMLLSFGGRTFSSPPTPNSLGQSDQPLVADLIEQGATGVQGFVDEPGGDGIAHTDVLFDSYTSGYSLAEAFYMASRYVYYMDAVVGDPLCAPYAYATTALDYSNWSTIARLGPIPRRGTTHVLQQVVIHADDSIPGPVTLVLSNLAHGTELANKTGLTMGGEPYILVSSADMARNTSVTVQLDLSGSDQNFTLSLIGGVGAR